MTKMTAATKGLMEVVSKKMDGSETIIDAPLADEGWELSFGSTLEWLLRRGFQEFCKPEI